MIAVLIIVCVVAEGAHDPSTDAIARAARETLGVDARIAVREQEAPASDAEIAALEGSAESARIAEVRWVDASRTHALVRVRVHVGSGARWRGREVTFDPLDAPAERGRALGFTIASMVDAPRAEAAPVLAPPIGAPKEALAVAPPPPRGAVYAAGVITAGIGGYAGSFGAALAGERRLAPAIAIRVGASVRSGEVAPAQATSLVAEGGVGMTITIVQPSRARAFGVGARADALVQFQSLTHLSSDDPAPVRESRWVPAADLLAEGSWALTDTTTLVAAAGAEAAFGTTEVFAHHARVAVVPPLRAVFELGVRAHF